VDKERLRHCEQDWNPTEHESQQSQGFVQPFSIQGLGPECTARIELNELGGGVMKSVTIGNFRITQMEDPRKVHIILLTTGESGVFRVDQLTDVIYQFFWRNF